MTFEEWWNIVRNLPNQNPEHIATLAWDARQPEIDQLKAQVAELHGHLHPKFDDGGVVEE